MSDLALSSTLFTTLRTFVATQQAATLVVGFSGGADSLALLHGLALLQRRGDWQGELRALHVHHGLSRHADAWAEYCRHFCTQEDIAFDLRHVHVDRHSGEGVEAAARRARYAAFAHYGGLNLVLAQHQDDQAETLLFNLLRGAGVTGAAAMPAERFLSGVNGAVRILRPLLSVTRTQIEDYAHANNLSWINDESNQDVQLRRNFLRHEIFPSLRTVFPSASSQLARAAQHFASAARLLEQLAELDWAHCRAANDGLMRDKLIALAPERALNLLRFVWRQAGLVMPDEAWWQEVWRQLSRTQNTAELCVRTKRAAWHVYRDVIYCVAAPYPHQLPTEIVRWQGEAEVLWAGRPLRFVRTYGKGLSYMRLQQGTTEIRPRCGGERLRVSLERPRQRVRNLLQEAAIAPWQRPYLPYLWCDNTLIWVHGFAHDPQFGCAPDEEGVSPLWE